MVGIGAGKCKDPEIKMEINFEFLLNKNILSN